MAEDYKRLYDCACRIAEFYQDSLVPDLLRMLEGCRAVVYCKDCKHMSVQPCGRYCFVWGGYNGMGDDGFCNYGERRGDT